MVSRADGSRRDRQRGTSCSKGEGAVRRRLNQSERSTFMAGNGADAEELCEELELLASRLPAVPLVIGLVGDC